MPNLIQERSMNWARNSLSRPGGRAVLSLLMSFRIWQKHGIFVPVKWHPDGYWIFRYPEAVIPKPTLFVDPVSPGDMEDEACDVFFQEYVPGPGDIVIDLGAEVGTEVNLFSRLVGPEGHVYAIEAHPASYEWLAKRCAASGLTNVTPVHLAISDHIGTVRLSDVTDSLENRLIDEDSGLEVRSLTLDAFMEEHGIDRVDFLKMNIEGAERLAIRGMKDRVSTIRNIAVECHDFLADRDGDDWYRTEAVVRKFLSDSGYEIVDRRSDDRRDWSRGYLYAFRAN
jgi:FkbM family methyltransferase